MICDWDLQTYEYWVEMIEKEKKDPRRAKSGIKMYPSHHFWDAENISENLWWAPYVQGFREISGHFDPVKSIHATQPPDAPSIKHAAASLAMAVNVTHYLQYLQYRIKEMGGKVIKARLPTYSGFAHALSAAETLALVNGQPRVDVFVNATGLGAAKLCGDETMYPVRGQTVLVKGEADSIRTRLGDGYTAYCIPRPGSGTTILGGTKQVDSWDDRVDPTTTEVILERCSWMVPELRTGRGHVDRGFEVVSVQCGFRPARRDGVRVEKEIVREGAGVGVKGKKVVHAYGHSGAGYQNSVGCARLVVRLVGESLGGDGKELAKL
ncbi:DAO-domain-containing protein [Teratosphaeria nubilosa]|uniref:DAO-domain-containing protein n=1 Tax=Teratosphaeria nubilosa TaxID=161662 RepID=A0A6G1L6S2_9PEZI|nr:DAO-domain-containing protein [Teratosphaeria nubilosa]